METLFVYGLVVVFFLLLIPVIYFLMHDPLPHADEEPADSADTAKIAIARVRTKIQPEQTISYGILAALFALMFVLTVLGQRTKA